MKKMKKKYKINTKIHVYVKKKQKNTEKVLIF